MTAKRCYYEVLNVSKEANDEDLKKSYRKLALKWHPDKNPDNLDEAKREFILIQLAFEVLSDPQERAFYDRHRESILRGAKSGFKDESVDVFGYFTSSCYSGFEDDEKGFYAVYREIFNKLAFEESEYLNDDDPSPPMFGNSKSPYDDVNKFYGYWLSFCTKKSFSWLDTWDLSEAENRQISRLMQQDNKRLRYKAKKERNELIRELVAIVRKRDKRVQAYSEYLKKKTEENSRKTEEHRRKQIAKHRKDIESCKEAEWSKFSNFENQLKEIESVVASEFNDLDDSGESEIDELFCVACNKSFRTEKTFANHEKSKKHKENVLSSDPESDESVIESSFCVACNKSFKTEKAFANHQRSKRHLQEIEKLNDTNDVSDDDSKLADRLDDDLVLSEENCDKSNADVGSVLEEDTDLVENVNSRSKKKQKTSKKKKKNIQPVASPESEEEEIDLHEVAGSKKQKKKLEREKILTNTEKKLSPRTLRKLKQMMEGMKPPPPEPKYMNDLIDFTGLDHRCGYCNQSFVSKNKLFKHLNSTGHAVYLPKETVSSCSSSCKTSRNRR